jgi:hypothetical protein
LLLADAIHDAFVAQFLHRPRRSSEIELQLIDKAPAPIFSRFKRSHDGMFCPVEVFGGVLVLR